MKSLIAVSEENDARLDRVLERLLPGMGLRGRRRLCELGLALVNGRASSPAHKIKKGDVVEITDDAICADNASSGTKTSDSKQLPSRHESPIDNTLFPEDTARLVLCTAHLAALCKPASMHTESLAGKPGTTLQALLPALLEEKPNARLLNRLDYPTSGLTLAALDDEGERLYHTAQDEGQTIKRYFAILEGTLSQEVVAVQRLILKNRSRVLVELAPHPDRRRHTRVQPLAVLDAAALDRSLRLSEHGWTGRLPDAVTLAGCTILKGARHQIRAHCAALGHPLLGDGRYGALFHPGNGRSEAFFLHHARFLMPGFDALALPVWLDALGKNVVKNAVRWLRD